MTKRKKTPTAQFIIVKKTELSAGARGYEFVFMSRTAQLLNLRSGRRQS
ncbi:MAG TPA: hypothetical protein VF553_05805 [Pyrinomonadaceae bacterium]|jgi:hypothetical protein